MMKKKLATLTNAKMIKKMNANTNTKSRKSTTATTNTTETTKLSSRQFMQLKNKTIEKRIVQFYQEDPSDLRFLKEVALLKIRQNLATPNGFYFPLENRVRALLRRLLKKQILSTIVRVLWQQLKKYFSKAEIFLLEKKFVNLKHFWQRAKRGVQWVGRQLLNAGERKESVPTEMSHISIFDRLQRAKFHEISELTNPPSSQQRINHLARIFTNPRPPDPNLHTPKIQNRPKTFRNIF
ncbi:hypothetical protein [Enterococcus timonensis]|uniref:hypothetical protein n=1 Tax=Enterococcus timonensis TaxID=1852364 RepID=UPI0008D944C1|nr:hypothetical protein [Enterococcus timonensis]